MCPAAKPAAATRLGPGLRVVRRGLDQLQVGLYDGRRAVLPRTAAAERTLERLLGHRPPEDDPAATAVLARLRAGGCLVEVAVARERTARRRSARVAVSGELPGADLAAILEAAALSRTGVASRADVVLVLSAGELARERLDPLIRARVPHLVVRLVDGGALLGPFAVPGVTACLRCVDAQTSVRDPNHVAVTSRYVRASERPRTDGVGDDPDPALVLLAATWAVRDIASHVTGRTPTTWSRTVHLDDDPACAGVQEWSRHPECGCCWSAGALSSGTMGA